jgi:hypothetical protein
MHRPSDVPQITVPVAEYGKREFWGLHQVMLSLGDVGSVRTQGGLGGDAIVVVWKDRSFCVRGLDIIRAVVATIDPKELERIP